jgi:hypothetical protein
MVAVGCGYRHMTTIGAAWALPNTLIGIGFALLSGAVPRRRDGMLIAETKGGLANLFLTRRGFGAITFGRVMVKRSFASSDQTSRSLTRERRSPVK